MSPGGKTALVTGGGRGIGRAVALALGREGVAVCLAARSQEQIAAVAAEITASGGRAFPVRADLRDENDIRSVVAATTKEFGGIDILVNNAGLGYFSRVGEMKTSHFDEMWQVNMRGVFLLTREVLPLMIGRGGGDIVNVSSLAGRNSFIGGAGYSATKWALIGFSRSLMLEVRENNIRVITLCPGSVDTDFAGPSGHAPRPGVIPSAEDIAAVVLDAVKMPRHVMVSEIDIRPTNPKARP
jgi:3-oxoacyl-[acyl-carrier protein] reductase